MKFVPLLALLCSVALAQGRWEFFYPASVTSLKCATEAVELEVHGSGVIQHVYQATAHAQRNDKSLGNWSMTIATYPQTLKGRHEAEKACSKWMDEASKRVKAAK